MNKDLHIAKNVHITKNAQLNYKLASVVNDKHFTEQRIHN